MATIEQSRSIAHTEIDFEKEGKQVGYIELPHSVHSDAWGVLRIPLCVIKNGSGPTIILEGGNHGDEYEGPVVLGELIRDLDPALVSGRLIIVPAINLPAVEAGSRVSPIDDLNFNRTFPGDALGTITEQLSFYVAHELFPLADIFVDLHSGGSSLMITPSAIMEPCPSPVLASKIRTAVLAFGAPMNVVISNYGDPRTSTACAVRAGLITIGTEMGGAGTVTPHALKICREGVFNLLRHFEILAPGHKDRQTIAPPAPLFEIGGNKAYVRAPEPGVFEPFHPLGEQVSAGEKAGRIHFLNNPQKTPLDLEYRMDGVVYGLRQPGIVRTGNCCLVVASPCKE